MTATQKTPPSSFSDSDVRFCRLKSSGICSVIQHKSPLRWFYLPCRLPTRQITLPQAQSLPADRAAHRNPGLGGDGGLARAQKSWHIQGPSEPPRLHNAPAHPQQSLPAGCWGFYLNTIAFLLVSSTVYHRPSDFASIPPLLSLAILIALTVLTPR